MKTITAININNKLIYKQNKNEISLQTYCMMHTEYRKISVYCRIMVPGWVSCGLNAAGCKIW